MWPFKPKAYLEAFCRDFYDRQIYRPRLAGVDVTEVYWDQIFEDVNTRFSSRLDRTGFHGEMTAAYFELFGLAWQLTVKARDLDVKQSVFTRQYLQERGDPGLWQKMGSYNQAIAQSFDAVRSRGERARRASLTFDNTYRVEMFKKWVQAGYDEECTARVCNRMGLKLDVQYAHAMMAAQLLTALGQDRVTFDDTFEVRAVFYGLYEGARKAMRAVSIQP